MIECNAKRCWTLLALSAFCIARDASAQNAVLTEMYGNGAHSYYAGDYQRAAAQLAAAIEGGSQDPRVFYFHGFALMKLGRAGEAEADFKAGAKLESEDINHFYPVARSLERVQGRSEWRSSASVRWREPRPTRGSSNATRCVMNNIAARSSACCVPRRRDQPSPLAAPRSPPKKRPRPGESWRSGRGCRGRRSVCRGRGARRWRDGG